MNLTCLDGQWKGPGSRGIVPSARTSRFGRFTRLTNAFSKKVESHVHSLALFTTYYNFVRTRKTLRMTPAMAAGVSTRPWESAISLRWLKLRRQSPRGAGRTRSERPNVRLADSGQRSYGHQLVEARWAAN